jgi:O-antigen/teichoic acid export membrane protein
VASVTSLALLPFIVGHVGKDAYGLYVLLVTVTGYFTLLDFGVSAAVMRYAAEARGRGEMPEAHRIINAALSYYLVIGVVAATLLVVFAPLAGRFFDLGTVGQGTARELFLVGAAFALVLWPTSVFRSVSEAFQRYEITASVTTGTQLLAALAIVVALRRGAGVTAVLVLTNLGILAANVILFVVLRRNQPRYRPAILVRDRAPFRRMFTFSTYMFVGGVASLVVFQLDNVIVGAFLSASAVAVYNVAYVLHAGVKTIDNLINGPPWVAAAHLEGRGDHEAQRRLFIRGTRYIAALFLPAIVTLIVFVEVLVRYWMGPAFSDSVTPARILIASWLMVSLWEPGGGLVTVRGQFRVLVWIALANAALNLITSVSLVRSFGLTGVALGTTLGFVAIAPFQWAVIVRTLGVPFREVWRRALMRSLAPVAVAAGTAVTLLTQCPPTTLVLTLFEMAVTYGLAAAVAYATALEADDRRALRAMLTRVDSPKTTATVP